MPIVPAPVVMELGKKAKHERSPRALTLVEVEQWTATMREQGARDAAPVRGTVGMGGWVTSVSGMPTSDEEAAGNE